MAQAAVRAVSSSAAAMPLVVRATAQGSCDAWHAAPRNKSCVLLATMEKLVVMRRYHGMVHAATHGLRGRMDWWIWCCDCRLVTGSGSGAN